MSDTVQTILDDLTGEESPCPGDYEDAVNNLLAGSGIGYSQLNELLLLLGHDRVTPAFFNFLLDVGREEDGAAFRSLDPLRAAVNCFRQRAILRFANVRHAFKYLSVLPEPQFSAELACCEL